ncbi:hypothetical protein Tco_1111371 [Tanacetum coccineum]|uniref:No apical meristem-associated C-terminal domain-containing protein n=1 Tax=Tanacetum coccineum TaxID=301880 RepID=A0ABQ5INX6_9ASTR
MEDFNKRTKSAPRTKNMMTGKWSRINSDCQKFNAIYKHLTRKSGENEADHIENAKDTYMERSGNKKFQYIHAWNILKSYPKWDAAKLIDEDDLAELFSLDTRARPAGQPRPPKKQNQWTPAYEAKRKKELGLLECKELEFLMIDPFSLSSEKTAYIRRKQDEIMKKYPKA